jgi:hypothetical protein
MAPEHQTTLKAEKQVLADRFDCHESLPVETLHDLFRRCARVGSLDLDRLPDQRL